MRKIWGPQISEAAAAFRVADLADRFIDAWLDKRITADLVRSLIASLHELADNTVGGPDFRSRAEVLEEAEFLVSNTTLEWPDGPCVVWTEEDPETVEQ